jgi:acyl-coenzyme A thioesterase PaaI-like protein
MSAPSEHLTVLSELVATTRDLMHATGTTAAQPEQIRQAQRLIADAAALLGEQPRTRLHRWPFAQRWAERARSGEEQIHLAPLNPLYIPLAVTIQGQRASAVMTPGALHEGPPDHFHGGFSAAILDHLLGHLVFAQGIPAVTAHLDLTYHKAVVLDEPIEIIGEVTAVDGRKVHADAWISQHGVRAVDARGLFIQGGPAVPTHHE